MKFPVVFMYAGKEKTGVLTKIQGMNKWFLHSKEYLVDVLIWENGTFRFQEGKHGLKEQLPYFETVVIAGYE